MNETIRIECEMVLCYREPLMRSSNYSCDPNFTRIQNVEHKNFHLTLSFIKLHYETNKQRTKISKLSFEASKYIRETKQISKCCEIISVDLIHSSFGNEIQMSMVSQMKNRSIESITAFQIF